jgi:tetratricopeptide (TPR) repeat protein
MTTLEPALTDRWGVAVTAGGPEARHWWNQAVGDLVAFTGDPVHAARTALDADAGFGEARALCAYLELYAQTPDGIAAARRFLDEDPVPAPGPGGAGTRRDLHLQAARAWAAGDLDGAAGRLEAALLADPHDLLALRVAQDLYFFLGDGRSLRQSTARIVRRWPAGAPGSGYVQGIYSFGLEESGDYRRAEASARAALDADPADVWAVHSMAHIAEMEGRPDDGIADLTERAPQWRSSYFAVHNWWHLGLFLIANGDYGEAVALYDGTLRATGSGAWLDLVDAASLLWRLALCGIDVGERAAALVELVEPIAGTGISAFNDWHAAMVFGLAGREDLGRALLASLPCAVATNARVVHRAGRDVIEAFSSFARGDFASAAALLFAVRPQAQVLGGSHAQRDVLDLTLLSAAASSGDAPLLRALGDERLESRPGQTGPLDRLIGARRAC